MKHESFTCCLSRQVFFLSGTNDSLISIMPLAACSKSPFQSWATCLQSFRVFGSNLHINWCRNKGLPTAWAALFYSSPGSSGKGPGKQQQNKREKKTEKKQKTSECRMGHAVSRIKVGPENKGQPWARGKLSAGMLYICYTLHICMYYISYIYIYDTQDWLVTSSRVREML